MELSSIAQIVLPWSITTVLSFALGFLTTRLRQINQRDIAMADGIRVLLRKQLVDSYDKFVVQKHRMTVERKAEIDEAYKAYAALEGNGTITTMYQEIQEVSVWIERD